MFVTPCALISNNSLYSKYNFLNMFTGRIAMSNLDTISPTVKVKTEVKTEILDHVIKKEIKSEQEDVTGKSHGFICPTCKAHFLYDTFFIEHVKEHHENMADDNSNSYEPLSFFRTIA